MLFKFGDNEIKEIRCGALCYKYESVPELMEDLNRLDTDEFRRSNADYRRQAFGQEEPE